MPERPDDALARSVHLFRVLPAKNFITQRRTQGANDAVHSSRNEGDLDAARPRKWRKPCVIMRIDRVVLWLLHVPQDYVGLWHVVLLDDPAFIYKIECAGSSADV